MEYLEDNTFYRRLRIISVHINIYCLPMLHDYYTNWNLFWCIKIWIHSKLVESSIDECTEYGAWSTSHITVYCANWCNVIDRPNKYYVYAILIFMMVLKIKCSSIRIAQINCNNFTNCTKSYDNMHCKYHAASCAYIITNIIILSLK